MAKGIDQGFAKSERWEQWPILALQQARLDAAGDRQIAFKKRGRLLQQRQSVPVQLTLVREFVLGGSAKTGQAKLALWVVGQSFSPEQDNCGIQRFAAEAKAKSVQQVSGIANRGPGRQPSAANSHGRGATDFIQVEVAEADPSGGPILPAVPSMGAFEQQALGIAPAGGIPVDRIGDQHCCA
ncbi:MAG: hypothetical protein ACRD11_16130 [Terriglobia bacterium]